MRTLRHVHAVEHGARGKGARELGMANLARRVVRRIEAPYELEIARRNVDGPRNRGAARVFGTLQHPLRGGPVRGGVELQPAARARAAATFSTELLATVETICSEFLLLAARATAISPSSWNIFWAPTGHRKTGEFTFWPNSSTDMSGLAMSVSCRGLEADLFEAGAVGLDGAQVVGALREISNVAEVEL